MAYKKSKRGMHMMPGGKMMKDSEMEPMMRKDVIETMMGKAMPRRRKVLHKNS